ncbi:MAG TPA: c-type cytochrome biogenesis protein CcmI [Gammaproteobacteria bacterium]|nr:c-type cytochrome biogenesis protein CcmI [Gammaproteobacteria bacterium]
MTSFILSALVLVALAVLIVVPALLRKNYSVVDKYDDYNVAIAKDRLKEIKQQRDAGEITEQAYQQLHDELEAALAVDLAVDSVADMTAEPDQPDKKKLSTILIAISIPVLAVVFYSQLGDFNAATGQPVVQTQPAAMAQTDGNNSQQDGQKPPEMTMEEAAAGLEKRLLEEPDNAEGWYMLGRTYMVLKKYQKAKAAYEKTIDLVGEDPEILLRYVDALAMTEDGKLSGAAKPILDKVIRMLPESTMALWLAGTAESQIGNYKKALTYWYKLLPLLNGSVNDQTELRKLIASAESNLTPGQVAELKKSLAVVDSSPVQIPVSRPGAESAPADGSAGEVAIRVLVDLDPSLKGRVSGSDTLFIFAKALKGPPMPLAAIKKTVADLPLSVTLDDAMAMMPQMKLSNFKDVKVSAVISKSGQPGAKPGDLFVEVFPVSVNAREEVILLINQVK